MEPSNMGLLQKIAEQTEENTRILKKIQRNMRFTRIMSMIYWVLVIGSLFGAYYFIQPYLESVIGGASEAAETYSELSGQINNLGGYFKR